jgi:hypothetical protein
MTKKTETEEHFVKKTMWTRVMTGTKSVTRSGTWKSTGKATSKAVKKLIPHSAKLGKDSSGFNLRYYREAYFALNEQDQYNLFMSGFAPKMTKREVSKLRATFRDGLPTHTYRPQTVMYDAHISPTGREAQPKDLVDEAAAAKRRAVEMAKQRRQAAAAASGDALPAHPTPATYTKIQAHSSRPTKARLQKQQKQQQRPAAQGQGKRPPQRQPQERIGVAVSHDGRPLPPQQPQKRRQGLRQGQPRVRPPAGVPVPVPVSRTGGRRVVGQSVAGSSRG